MTDSSRGQRLTAIYETGNAKLAWNVGHCFFYPWQRASQGSLYSDLNLQRQQLSFDRLLCGWEQPYAEEFRGGFLSEEYPGIAYFERSRLQ